MGDKVHRRRTHRAISKIQNRGSVMDSVSPVFSGCEPYIYVCIALKL